MTKPYEVYPEAYLRNRGYNKRMYITRVKRTHTTYEKRWRDPDLEWTPAYENGKGGFNPVSGASA